MERWSRLAYLNLALAAWTQTWGSAGSSTKGDLSAPLLKPVQVSLPHQLALALDVVASREQEDKQAAAPTTFSQTQSVVVVVASIDI